MKIFTIIFGCYLLTLSLLPCGDQDGCGSRQSADTSYSDNSHDDHGEEHTDTCSPFCSCTCCGQTTIIHVQTILSFNPTIALVEKANFYKQSAPQDISFGIWQPPKIG